jgi:hypothetical protein
MDYTIDRRSSTGMISGQGEVVRRIFRKYEGKSGNTWYIPINQENVGDNVYVDTHDPKSDGFGGATLPFHLEDGTVDRVKGAWHSNSKAFTKDVGIDITKTHLTFVVISRGRDQDGHWNTVMTDVLYKDDAPTIGDFDRWKEIAKQFKDEPELFYYSASSGGSSCGPINENDLK